jgi:hypothetical protein
MAPVPVVLELPAQPALAPQQLDEVTFVDMDDFSTEHKCACAASDDNPY